MNRTRSPANATTTQASRIPRWLQRLRWPKYSPTCRVMRAKAAAANDLLLAMLITTTAIPCGAIEIHPDYQPTDVSVSVGDTVTFRVALVSGSYVAPVAYQWYFKEPTTSPEMAIDSAKNPSAATYTLSITNVQLADAGGYFVIATDSDSPPGSATSRVAILKVDPTFTKITKGQVVEDQGPWGSGYWGDFDGDGLVDLFVPANILPPNTYYKCALYRNLGGDKFERVTNAATDKVKQTWWSLWADFDNNGTLDLFALHPAAKNELFRNDGRGNFTPVFCTVTSYTGTHWGAEWVDFDRDGFLDILVTAYNGKPRFFHGRGDGYFWVWTSSDVGPWINDVSSTFAPAFCDIDGDGDADLYMSEAFGLNALYRNDGTGQLEPVTAGTLPTGLSTASVLWADINNDGLFDLLTVDYDPGTDLPGALRFYRNLGEWEFQDATVEAGLDSPMAGWAVAVADFDNDGDLDIYAPNYMGTDALYENQGDGTFVQKDVGSPLTEGTRDGAAWADYNNDGFMDLFKGCGDLVTARSLLYRNSLKELAGNNNGWLMVEPVPKDPVFEKAFATALAGACRLCFSQRFALLQLSF